MAPGRLASKGERLGHKAVFVEFYCFDLHLSELLFHGKSIRADRANGFLVGARRGGRG